MTQEREALEMSLKFVESNHSGGPDAFELITTIKEALAQPQQSDAEYAIAAGDAVLMKEQASLLRMCRMALDDLLKNKPMLGAKMCGVTTLGNLKAELYDYRPQGIFGERNEKST